MGESKYIDKAGQVTVGLSAALILLSKEIIVIGPEFHYVWLLAIAWKLFGPMFYPEYIEYAYNLSEVRSVLRARGSVDGMVHFRISELIRFLSSTNRTT
jgi:hypothetical protein